LLLRGRLSSLPEHLILMDGVGNLVCLASEIEVFADVLLGCRFGSKSIVVECVVSLVELVA
jgi:hypothetical protein